jgi:hypothetical protein
MNPKKKQKINEGSIVKIELSLKRVSFGRLFPGGRVGVFDSIVPKDKPYPAIEKIIKLPIFLYCVIYDDVITRNKFEVIGFEELTHEDLNKIPPIFTQDTINLNDCIISYYTGEKKKATPHECVGLERSSVWEADGLIRRIEDHFEGRKFFYEELFKPILTKDDVRYMAGPNLKWSFEEEKFYKV